MDLLTYIYTKTNTLGASIVGKSQAGSTGPFYGVAPEKTPFDYVVYTISAGGNIISGLDGIMTYVSQPFVSIDCYCSGGSSAARAMANAESICHIFDKIVKESIGSDYVIQFNRKSDPFLFAEDTTTGNERVYHASIGYKVLVHRNY